MSLFTSKDERGYAALLSIVDYKVVGGYRKDEKA